MTPREMEDALSEIEILERRRTRLMERARFIENSDDPARADLFYQWADACSDEVGRRKDELWAAHGAAAHDAKARGEMPL